MSGSHGNVGMRGMIVGIVAVLMLVIGGFLAGAVGRPINGSPPPCRSVPILRPCQRTSWNPCVCRWFWEPGGTEATRPVRWEASAVPPWREVPRQSWGLLQHDHEATFSDVPPGTFRRWVGSIGDAATNKTDGRIP